MNGSVRGLTWLTVDRPPVTMKRFIFNGCVLRAAFEFLWPGMSVLCAAVDRDALKRRAADFSPEIAARRYLDLLGFV